MIHEDAHPVGTRHRAELAALPSWYATALVAAAALVAAVAILVPSVAFAGMRAAPLPTGALGVALALGGYVALARIAGVSPGALFFGRPHGAAVRWAIVGLVVASVVPLSLATLGRGTFVLGYRGIDELAFAVLASVTLGLWTGTVEEGLMRGYVLAVLEARWHAPGAILTSSLLFGLLHHGATDSVHGRIGYVAVTATAGAVLSLVAIRSRDVWNPVAFHAAWNAAFSPWLLGIGPLDGGPVPPVRYSSDPTHPLLGGQAVAPTESPIVLGGFVALAAILVASGRHVRGSPRS